MKTLFVLVLCLLIATVKVYALHEFSCNVVGNGFETDSSWISYNSDPVTFTSATSVCGNSSLVFSSTTRNESLGAYQVIDIASLISTKNYEIYFNNSITWVLEGFSKSLNVNSGSPSDYSLYVDYSSDGQSRAPVAFLPFSSGTNDWERLTTYFTTPASGFLYVYVLFRSRIGTSWFDGISLMYKNPEVNNLLGNGGFEYNANLGKFGAPALGWDFATNVGYSISDITTDSTLSHSGLRSGKISITEGQSMWIQQEVLGLNLNKSSPILISAWSKSNLVTGMLIFCKTYM